jgi:hypothetical protein
LTLVHPDDIEDTGVRIALHYGPGDSFADNILRGGLPGETPVGGVLAAGPSDVADNQRVSYTVTLPAGKTCNFCTLQWVWAARSGE